MTVRGIEAIKLYIPQSEEKCEISTNIKEETGRVSPQVNNEPQLKTKTVSMTSVERYRQEWAQLLQTLDTNPESIRDAAYNGELKMSKFRSVHWALLLRVLHPDYNSWCVQRAQQRTRYENFCVDFVRNPHEIDVPDDDPLSQSTKSVWNQYFSDQELFAVIRQDVIRTFPGVDFFRKPFVQNAMTNILFFYAREHPYMCYRQGMHEILAPIIFVLYGDQQSLLHFKEIAKTDINEILMDVLNPLFLEADSYSIFSRLMCSVESYYRITNLLPGAEYGSRLEHTNEFQTEVEVIGQLNRIRDKILAKADLHLHNYLLKLDIPLHLFGIRWLRLLFGREFPLLDLLTLWDAIFADSDHFELPNYILVAMLVNIRNKLLLSDYTTALTHLMRYPTNVDVNMVLRHALHMMNPKKFVEPANAYDFASFRTSLPVSSAAPVTEVHSSPNKSITQSSKRNHSVPSANTILQTDTLNNMDTQITELQKRNAAQSAALAKLQLDPTATRIAMDGYLENSPDLLHLELKNAQTVIKIARNKLLNYLGIVRKHVPKQQSANDELHNTLDNIEELCSFLDVKFMFPLQVQMTPIDQAHEANEQKDRISPVETLTPAERIKANTSSNVLYEKPESALMFNTTRTLGNLREIELKTIASDEKPFPHQHQNSQLSQNGLPTADPLQHVG